MEDKNEDILILVTYVKISPNREKIVKVLRENDTLQPSDISKKSEIHSNTVSKGLKQLREKDIVRLLNPDAKRGRLYKLTTKGREIAKNI